VGKSIIARHVVLDALAAGQPLENEIICWVDAADGASLRAAYHELARRMSSKGRHAARDPEASPDVARELRDRLAASRQPWLVVLDNADAGSLIASGLLPPNSNPLGRVLITTAQSDPRLAGYAEAVPVGLFTRSQTVAHVRSQRSPLNTAVPPRIAHDPEEDIAALSDAVGALPLAVAVATATAAHNGLTARDWTEEFGTAPAMDLAADAPDPGGYPTTLGRAWSAALDRAARFNPGVLVEGADEDEARAVVARAAAVTALLDPDGHPAWLWDREPVGSWVAGGGRLTTRHGRPEVLRRLALHNLVALDHEAALVRMHPLTARAVLEGWGGAGGGARGDGPGSPRNAGAERRDFVGWGIGQMGGRAGLEAARDILAQELTEPWPENYLEAAPRVGSITRLLELFPSWESREAAACRTLAGDYARWMRDQAGARAMYQDALAVFRRLAEDEPENVGAGRDLSICLDSLGAALRSAGDQAGARAAHEESLAIRRDLAAALPGDVQAQRDLSVSLNNLGGTLLAAGDRAGARAMHLDSLAIGRELAAAQPGDAQALRDLSVSLERLGDVLRQGEDRAEARAAYEESLEIRRGLAASQPGDVQAQRDLSVACDKTGDLLRADGDHAGARAAFDESLRLRRGLAAAQPGNAQAQRDLSISCERTGDMLRADGDHATAHAMYEESLAIRRRAAEADPGDPQASRDLAAALDKMGDTLRARGDHMGAHGLYEESVAIRRRAAEADPSNRPARRDLATALDRMGHVLDSIGYQVGAQSRFDESLAVFRELAESQPQDIEAQRCLAVSLSQAGRMAFAAGDPVLARSRHHEAVGIFWRLAQAQPASVPARRDLSVTLVELGDAIRAGGDAAEARRVYEDALAMAREVANFQPCDSQSGHALAHVIRQLLRLLEDTGQTEAAARLEPEYRDLVRRLKRP
jgi:tetratricopeptide (TPR) repeat protein